jgi:glycosyltransferase involved in cell wall biosynthesis
MSIALALLALVLVVQILYLVILFSRISLEKASSSEQYAYPKTISVIICAWNELVNLQELLPILAKQDYQAFEVIIVNDRSSDGTDDYLKENIGQYKNFSFITITETPEHLTSKKYALSLGIKMAKGEFILLTDADCRPETEQWISAMAHQATKGKKFVLGFSPYWKEASFLNGFIRFETFFTAWTYFSFSLFGKPYMGVGRNLLYDRQLFFDSLGFRNHQKIAGGDDDLFVNENATSRNTAICLNPDSFVYSEPKHSFKDWYTQKSRHLGIGRFYKKSHKMLLGAFALSHVLSWFLLPLLFFASPHLQVFIGVAAILRLVLFWLFGSIANYKLDKTIGWYSLPFYDLVLAFYYATMGWISIIKLRKKAWR